MENQFSFKHIGHGLVLGPYDYSDILNWTYGSARNISSGLHPESTDDITQAALSPLSPLGAVTATLVTFLLSSQGAYKIKHVFDFQSWLLGAFILVMLIFTLPLFAILTLYHSAVFYLLRVGSQTFISLMDGPDAIWNLDDSSQPIITVLAEIEAEGAECLLNAIQEAVLKAALANPKLIWKRKYSCMGYSYWQACSDLSFLKEHIHWMPYEKQNSEDHITLSELQILISNIAHQGLPNENTCWEILVSRKRLIMASEESYLVYPVLFRIHHSLGDGVSLLEFLMNSLSTVSNKQPYKSSFSLNKFSIYEEKVEQTGDVAMKNEKIKRKRGITEVFISKGGVHFGSVQEVSHPQQKKTLISSLVEKVNFLASFGSKLQYMRMIIYSQKKIKESCEISILDANKISGKKLIAWHTDSPQGSTFFCVKRIKSEIKGVRFTDVMLTAISKTIEKYLKDKNAYIPNCISVVMPIYMGPYFNYRACKLKTSATAKTIQNECINILEPEKIKIEDCHNNRNSKLKNSFSLGVLNLPINTGNKTTCISLLKKVAQNMDFMHKSGQFELNSFILKWFANLLPAPFLNKFLQLIGHNTMVISNLVGPTDILFLAGYPLRNIYFWVPQRANTAISVSILSYCNRLQLGLMIDRTIMSTAEEVQFFLDEVVTEVTKLVDETAHETGNGAYF